MLLTLATGTDILDQNSSVLPDLSQLINTQHKITKMKNQISTYFTLKSRHCIWLFTLTFCFISFLTTSSFANAGDLDLSFGDGGLVTTDIGGDYGAGHIAGVLVQPDGKIIAAAGSDGCHLLRINPDGSLDESFGDGGDLTVSNPSIAEFEWVIKSWALLPNGKILLSGNLRLLTGFECPPSPIGGCHDIYTNDFLLVRYNSDGSLDTTFGIDGKVTTDFSDRYSTETNDYLNQIAVQNDGTIIGIGINHLRDSYPYEKHTIIVRYTPEGVLDRSFGEDGVVEFGVGVGYSSEISARKLFLQSDGKLLIIGDSSEELEYSLIRYNLDGSVDTTFGVDGKISPIPWGYDIYRQDDVT